MKCLECNVEMEVKTEDRYKYVESGLDYIYLVGLTVERCPKCNATVAQIPNVRNLHLAIGLAIIENPRPLNGAEIRFLRKAVGMKAKDLARKLGYQPEVLSRYENDKEPMGEQGDRLLRVLFWGEKQKEIGLYKSLLEVMNSFERMKADPGVIWCREVRTPVEIDPNHLPVPVQHQELQSVN